MIQPLSSASLLQQCIDLQRRIWGFGDADTLPMHILTTFFLGRSPWGIGLGVLTEERLVAFALCFPTSEPSAYWLHMIGVDPPLQAGRSGYGRQLMHAVGAEARRRLARKVVWTYDPLESVNANLYIAKLGAVCREYVDEAYVFGESAMHGGVPSDRLKAEWFLHGEERDAVVAVYGSEANLVAVPCDFQELRRTDMAVARAWRLRTREQFHTLLGQQSRIVSGFRYDPVARTSAYVVTG